ncbi:coiled-coil-helix-coiled-coil-helix domain-containing protein 7 isoform X1 [Calypte anna]|uniref:coiled-coil-helix-coiled-coil-helix domain-containing protein 7 isoform X1 n=1 Tax=Calypte anna TaxID=9244 RepID=UPI0011C3CF56|nr:coiled-coil-helix-coiled-coil-helix domain-containing protein 7 isoform X1 [Calypte anna]
MYGRTTCDELHLTQEVHSCFCTSLSEEVGHAASQERSQRVLGAEPVALGGFPPGGGSSAGMAAAALTAELLLRRVCEGRIDPCHTSHPRNSKRSQLETQAKERCKHTGLNSVKVWEDNQDTGAPAV